MRLPLLGAKEIIKILLLKGYQKANQGDSHVQFKNGKGVVVTVPLHTGRKVGSGVLRKILRDTEITREELERLLKEI